MRKINFDIKKPKLSLLITIIFVVLMLLGTSFAYFLVSGGSLLGKVETGKISVNYTEGNIIRNNNFIPLTPDEVLEHATKLDFSVTNDGTAKTYVNIEFSDVTIADELKSEDTKWSLYQDNNVIATGNFSNVTSSLSLSKNILFEINDTKNYTVYIWINENGGDQSSMQGKSLSAKMKVYANQRKSMDSRLADYKIYGNSTQETRSGKNLLDPELVNTILSENDLNYHYSKTVQDEVECYEFKTGSSFIPILTDFKGNAQYTLSGMFKGSIMYNNSARFYFKYNDETYSYFGLTNTTWNHISITSTAGKTVVEFGAYAINGIAYPSYLYDVQLEEGTTATSYEPYGLMPSPEFPSEVVSLGENSKNLLNLANYPSRSFMTNNTNTELIINKIDSSLSVRIPSSRLKPNTNYVVSCKIDGEFSGRIYGFFGESLYSTDYHDGRYFHSFTTDSSGKSSDKLSLSIYQNHSSNDINLNIKGDSIRIYDIQLEEGSSPTEYKPYRYIDVESSGKNLFNPMDAELTNVTLSNGTFTTLSISNEIDYYLPAGTYIVSGKQNTTKTIYFRKGKVASGVIGEVSGEQFSKTLTLTSDDYLRILIFNPDRIIEDIQIEKGTTVTDYEPYKEIITPIDLTGHEPLRKIGDVADYIDYKNGKIVRNIGKVVFSGAEDYSLVDTSTYAMKLNQNVFAGKNNALNNNSSYCSHARLSNAMYITWYSIPANNQIEFRQIVSNWGVQTYSVDAWKQWLETQNTNGTPVTVYYQLKKPIIEDIDLPELPLNSGTTILTVNGTNQVNTFN